ncbi:hypothetical protein SCWH03_24930 [Streptomyces pacificus]|uniref:Uncharacterized protein n=1 Tax=Streptomyces pacificus TaxID=2705029 RepID=A0A6A0AXG0_9ACTN|nr:hypothetical protein SCWH03_24930 [Streptomyces pacificus]
MKAAPGPVRRTGRVPVVPVTAMLAAVRDPGMPARLGAVPFGGYAPGPAGSPAPVSGDGLAIGPAFMNAGGQWAGGMPRLRPVRPPPPGRTRCGRRAPRAARGAAKIP